MVKTHCGRTLPKTFKHATRAVSAANPAVKGNRKLRAVRASISSSFPASQYAPALTSSSIETGHPSQDPAAIPRSKSTLCHFLLDGRSNLQALVGDSFISRDWASWLL